MSVCMNVCMGVGHECVGCVRVWDGVYTRL